MGSTGIAYDFCLAFGQQELNFLCLTVVYGEQCCNAVVMLSVMLMINLAAFVLDLGVHLVPLGTNFRNIKVAKVVPNC